ncbi:MAG: hypothetical protein HWD58_19325 [Bacteroidota bacterium]|nr:MAG: hypothetical protein HWD58_19325 [Bacteroidota bacterium]
MEFSPPVNKRSTDELFDIISNNEKWGKEIQILAKEELFIRNFTKELIEKKDKKN